MLTQFQQAKLIEWAEWRMIQPDDGIMPRIIGAVDEWVYEMFVWGVDHPFPDPEANGPLTFGN